MISERLVLSYKGFTQRVSSIGKAVEIAKRDSKGSNKDILGILTDENVPGFIYEITSETTLAEVEIAYRKYLSI